MSLSVLMMVMAVFVCAALAQHYDDSGFYANRYDYVDVEEILNSKRLVKNYADCLLNLKPCPPEGKELKSILPEALRTKCARCTENQKTGALKILKKLKKDYPRDWERLIAKWDPTRDLTRTFEYYLERERLNNIPHKGEPNQPRPVFTTTTEELPPLINRFGDFDDDSTASNSGGLPPVRIPVTTSTEVPTSSSTTPNAPSVPEETLDNAISGDSSLVDAEVATVTRSPRPSYNTGSFNSVPDSLFTPLNGPNRNPVFANTVGLIDLFGSKIIRTTNIVADLLRNTLRLFWNCVQKQNH